MSLFEKPLEQLEESDLQSLLIEGVEEGILLDYKADWIDNKKLAKAVASFANTHGGHLVIGVAADKDRNAPQAIPGILFGEGIKEKVGAICRSRISPAPVFRMKIIELRDRPSRCVLVVEVPESPQPPHYVNGVIYVRNGESSGPLEALRNFFLIEKLYEKRAFQEERLERLISERRIVHNFAKADYSLSLLTCPSLPGRSPLPLFRKEFYHELGALWDYQGRRIEPRTLTMFNESRWQERTTVISGDGWIEQAAGVCFPSKSGELIQEAKLFHEILPVALERAVAVYSHSLVQYYGSLRIRVSLHGVQGRRLLRCDAGGEDTGETSRGPYDDPVVCDRVATVPVLSQAEGRSGFCDSVIREVRRAFGELEFEPEEPNFLTSDVDTARLALP